MTLQGKTVNVLGDSITESTGASCPENGYVAVFERTFGLKEARNYGVSGSRIASQEKPYGPPRMERNFCTRAREMDENADAVVVFGGTNDFGHGDRPIGSFEDKTEDTFYGACRVLMETLLERYHGKPIVIMTPLHRSNEQDPWGDHRREHPTLPLCGYVKIIKEVAEYYSLPVLDLWAVSGMQPAVPVIKEKYMPDGLHPSDAGHALIANLLGNFLLGL